MSLEYPTYDEVIARIRAEVQRFLPDLDPSIFGSIIRAFTDSLGGRSIDNLEIVRELEKQFNPLTATGEFLEVWAAYEDLVRTSASAASGGITLTGTPGSTVPTATVLTSVTGASYETLALTSIVATVLSVTSVTRVGTTATATTSSAHRLASGMTVTIAGAVETDYNGAVEITVLTEDTFTYEVSGSPTTPATGTITASVDAGFADVESQGQGVDQNAAAGATLTLSTPVVGVDSVAYVQFDEITGGLDEETDEALRTRVFQSRASVVTEFNPAAIEKLVLAIAGVTRVKVNRITPAVGQVTILFVRDNDPDIIPNPTQVAEVETAVLAILPADKDTGDVFVAAPTPVTVNFAFSAIAPSTTTMQEAIQTQLAAFFEDGVDFETDVTEDAYRAAIINTVDPVERVRLTSFTLTTPAGDVSVSAGELAVLGTVTF